MKTNAQLLAAMRNQNISTGTIRLFVTLVVALGIASVLVVSVVQKQKEIGILRAMGASRRRIMSVFLLQGGMVALGGSMVGLAARRRAGADLRAGRSSTPTARRCSCRRSARRSCSPTWAVALFTGLLAAVLPARRAAQLDPVAGDPPWMSVAPREPILALEGVRKSYNVGTPVEAEVLHGIDLALEPGEFAALIGPSGSGKSTLLNIIGLLERPTAGRMLHRGTRVDHARRDGPDASCAGAPSDSSSSSTTCCRRSPRSRT